MPTQALHQDAANLLQRLEELSSDLRFSFPKVQNKWFFGQLEETLQVLNSETVSQSDLEKAQSLLETFLAFQEAAQSINIEDQQGEVGEILAELSRQAKSTVAKASPDYAAKATLKSISKTLREAETRLSTFSEEDKADWYALQDEYAQCKNRYTQLKNELQHNTGIEWLLKGYSRYYTAARLEALRENTASDPSQIIKASHAAGVAGAKARLQEVVQEQAAIYLSHVTLLNNDIEDLRQSSEKFAEQ